MTKKSQPKPEVLEEYIHLKDEFKQQYTRKKVTQTQAKERRKFIRERKEDRDYS